MAVEAYREISKQIDQPLTHGYYRGGRFSQWLLVKSAIGLGLLLWEGIGDTLRVSLAADPVQEVKVGWDILKSLQLRSRGLNFIVLPQLLSSKFRRH